MRLVRSSVRRRSISNFESGGFFESDGGICSSGSALETRFTSGLVAAFPGTMAAFTASSRRSNRKSACLAALSGP